MTAITWLPVDELGDQRGTCPGGTFLIRAPNAGRQVRVAFHPDLDEGETLSSLTGRLAALKTWSPEGNRIAAMDPFLPGSALGWFHDRDSARDHLAWILAAPKPESLPAPDEQIRAAGFIPDRRDTQLYARRVGTSTFEISLRAESIDLRTFKTPDRWRNLVSLELPVAQPNPLVSVGLWPGKQADPRVLTAAVLMIATWALDAGLTSAPRRSRRIGD